MSTGKAPPEVKVTVFEPCVVLTLRLAAQGLFGAGTPSRGVGVGGGCVVSVFLGKKYTDEIRFPNSVSKFCCVELSVPLLKFVFESHIQLRKPAVDRKSTRLNSSHG